MTTTLSLSPSVFRDDEIQAAEALLALLLPQIKPTASSESRHRPVTRRFPRWGITRRRSVLKTEQENKPGLERLSPSTPLFFSPSGGEETTPPPPPPPPLPSRPPSTAKIFKNKEQHKEWVKEQTKKIATLSATKATLQQCVSEAKSRYQSLRESNSWLKELQSKLRETMVQRQRQFVYERSSRSELDLFPVGPACSLGHHLQQRRQLDLNRRTAEEEAAKWRLQQQRAAAYAQARKRRIELQRVKASLKIQRLG